MIPIGRGAASNPWIVRKIGEYLETGSYTEPTHSDRCEMMWTYYSMLMERPENEAVGAAREDDAAGKMKQFATYFTLGVRDGAKLRTALYHTKQAAEITALVEEFFTAPDTAVA